MEFRKTILIICEGRRSEPNYFAHLRDEVIDQLNGNVYIKILPLPKVDSKPENFELRKGAIKRQIKQTSIDIEDYKIENEYKAQPTCYVRKCQIGYLEDGYDELWAVYDQDGHSKQQEAYKLAIDKTKCDKIVNIGFSAISFEIWILLHFEYTTFKFVKSQCKEDKYTIYECGTDRHEDDCKGELCVCGKIVKESYLSYEESKYFETIYYDSYFPKAIKNALALRMYHYDSLAEFYNQNPIVTIDRLVFKLKNLISTDYIWIYGDFELNGFTYTFSFVNGGVSIIIINSKNIIHILNENDINLVDENNNILFKNVRKVIEAKSTVELHFAIEDFYAITIRKNEFETFIIDRSCI